MKAKKEYNSHRKNRKKWQNGLVDHFRTISRQKTLKFLKIQSSDSKRNFGKFSEKFKIENFSKKGLFSAFFWELSVTKTQIRYILTIILEKEDEGGFFHLSNQNRVFQFAVLQVVPSKTFFKKTNTSYITLKIEKIFLIKYFTLLFGRKNFFGKIFFCHISNTNFFFLTELV